MNLEDKANKMDVNRLKEANELSRKIFNEQSFFERFSKIDDVQDILIKGTQSQGFTIRDPDLIHDVFKLVSERLRAKIEILTEEFEAL